MLYVTRSVPGTNGDIVCSKAIIQLCGSILYLMSGITRSLIPLGVQCTDVLRCQT